MKSKKIEIEEDIISFKTAKLLTKKIISTITGYHQKKNDNIFEYFSI